MQRWIMGPKEEGNLSDKPLTVYFIFLKARRQYSVTKPERDSWGLYNFLLRKIPVRANTDANVVIQSHSVRNTRKDLFCFLLNEN